MIHVVEAEIAGRILSIESGRMAKQAGGSVLVRYGDTMVLATVAASKDPVEGNRGDFLPLTVEYREKMYAAGKIPGNFFKREGRPGESEILSARLIDRPIRPLFPKGYYNEVQIVVNVLSSDQENPADILGIIGASSALFASSIPVDIPVGAARIGKVDGVYVVNPTISDLDMSTLDIVVAATKDSVTQVEGSAIEVSNDEIAEAIALGYEEAKKVCDLQHELVELCGKEKLPFHAPDEDVELSSRVEEISRESVLEALSITDKLLRNEAIDRIIKHCMDELSDEFSDSEFAVESKVMEMVKREMRRRILDEGTRVDNRGADDIRPIVCEVGVTPRTHGSALFTRGQTQSFAVTTLGTKMDERMVDDLEVKTWKSFMLDYNFPPFSVGEVKPIRGPGRREIGHGSLAEKALDPVTPSEEVFPYTIRVVSDILESNGSSSMATVCAGSLSLMDAGVPIKTSVAGIAMGLVKEDERWVVLSDISGIEDHFGDMDFKVAGTRDGITAIQMDLKLPKISSDIIRETLEKSAIARNSILDIMEKTLPAPRDQLSSYAPRIISLKIKPSQIGMVIGTGGKTIREIQDKTGAKVEIEDDGTVMISSVDQNAGEEALKIIEQIVMEPEVGDVYEGKVKRITSFGAFVEIAPGKEGLVHISDLDHKRVEKVEDVVKEGDVLKVKVVGIDNLGRIKVSRKALLDAPAYQRDPRPNKGKRFKRFDK